MSGEGIAQSTFLRLRGVRAARSVQRSKQDLIINILSLVNHTQIIHQDIAVDINSPGRVSPDVGNISDVFIYQGHRMRSALFHREHSELGGLFTHQGIGSFECIFDLTIEDGILHIFLELADGIAWFYTE